MPDVIPYAQDSRYDDPERQNPGQTDTGQIRLLAMVRAKRTRFLLPLSTRLRRRFVDGSERLCTRRGPNRFFTGVIRPWMLGRESIRKMPMG